MTTNKPADPCYGKYRQAGWVFNYEPATGFVSMNHPLHGRKTACLVPAAWHNDWEADELGHAIAAFLNGEGADD